MTVYAYGYGSGRCTMSELRARYEPKMEPEYARRLFAWIEAQGGAIGIGGGWRSTQPSKPGFAPDGKSFHQSQTFDDGFVGYCAVDLVHVNGNAAHRAPTWSEVPAQGSADAAKWGVHANVSGEAWHLQPVEIDGWQSWSNAGRPRPKAGYSIPSSGGGDLERPDLEGGEYGLFPLDPDKPEIKKGSKDSTSGDKVSYLQAVLRNECGLTIDIDGTFGTKTEKATKEMQGWNDLKVDGRCGPATWGAVDAYTA